MLVVSGTSFANEAVYRYRGADRDSRLLENARKEGSVVLYTSLAPTESGPLGQAFEKKTGVKVEIFRTISEKVVQRAVTEARARRFAVDVSRPTAPRWRSWRARSSSRFPLALPRRPAGERDSVAPPVDPGRVNFFVVAYNTAKVKRDEIPKSYTGFTDPKWRGRIGIEATDAEWMATLVKTWGEAAGMAYFRSLAEMKPDVRKGHVLLAELIAAGEIPVGLTVYNSNAESLKRRGAPIDWLPVEPVVGRPQGIAVARNAPHPHAALLFVDFVLSPEGQELLNSMGRVPVSTKVKTDLNRFPYTMVDPVTVLDEQEKVEQALGGLFIRK